MLLKKLQTQLYNRTNIISKRFYTKGQPMIKGQAAPRFHRDKITHNPIIFNSINENLVVAGKERIVGVWLGMITASIFFTVTVGGYTRLTKSGLSMVRWEPNRILPPMTTKDWIEEFEEYKKSPEYLEVNSKKNMDLEGFKYIFFWEWFHRIIGRSIGVAFLAPMVYFWRSGWLRPRFKATLGALFILGGVQGAIGWWMVKSGLKNKEETSEVDKTPRVSPYRLATHAGFAYTLYATCLWQTMQLVRRPQEAYINTFEKVGANNYHRRALSRYVYAVVPIVLLTGFFTAGIGAGISCNTFPFVGDNWFYSKKHFLDSIPTWQNFTENKLICQVNHRTLASLLTLLITTQGYFILMRPFMTPMAKNSIVLLVLSLWGQMLIGMNVIWQHVPVWLASSHQIGAMTVLSAFMFTMHCSRRVDPRHIKNLMGKMKIDKPDEYKQVMGIINKQKHLTSRDKRLMKESHDEYLKKTKY